MRRFWPITHERDWFYPASSVCSSLAERMSYKPNRNETPEISTERCFFFLSGLHNKTHTLYFYGETGSQRDEIGLEVKQNVMISINIQNK